MIIIVVIAEILIINSYSFLQNLQTVVVIWIIIIIVIEVVVVTIVILTALLLVIVAHIFKIPSIYWSVGKKKKLSPLLSVLVSI